MSASLIGFRPKGDSGPVYSPQRDLAYCYIPAMKEAFESFMAGDWQDHIREICEQQGVTAEDFIDGANKLARSHMLFVGREDVKTPADAFAATLFDKVKPLVRILLFSRLGEVMLGGFFSAVRSTTLKDHVPLQADDMAAMMATARMIRWAFDKRTRPKLAEHEAEFCDKVKLMEVNAMLRESADKLSGQVMKLSGALAALTQKAKVSLDAAMAAAETKHKQEMERNNQEWTDHIAHVKWAQSIDPWYRRLGRAIRHIFNKETIT